MSNTEIGRVYEKRGEDFFVVVTTPDGDVVQVTQRQAVRMTYQSIDFFAESAPALVRLIQKAAGIEEPEVEYEYNIETTDLITGKVRFTHAMWEPTTDWLEGKLAEAEAYDRKLLNAGGGLEYSRRLVKRAKAGKVEGV